MKAPQHVHGKPSVSPSRVRRPLRRSCRHHRRLCAAHRSSTQSSGPPRQGDPTTPKEPSGPAPQPDPSAKALALAAALPRRRSPSSSSGPRAVQCARMGLLRSTARLVSLRCVAAGPHRRRQRLPSSWDRRQSRRMRSQRSSRWKTRACATSACRWQPSHSQCRLQA